MTTLECAIRARAKVEVLSFSRLLWPCHIHLLNKLRDDLDLIIDSLNEGSEA